MAKTITLNTARVVKPLAAKYDFDARDAPRPLPIPGPPWLLWLLSAALPLLTIGPWIDHCAFCCWRLVRLDRPLRSYLHLCTLHTCARRWLYVADTDAHQIRRIEIAASYIFESTIVIPSYSCAPSSTPSRARILTMPLPSHSHQTVPSFTPSPVPSLRARRYMSYEGTEGGNFSAGEHQQRLAARLQKRQQQLEEQLEKQWEAAHPSGLVDEDHPTDYKVHTAILEGADGR